MKLQDAYSTIEKLISESDRKSDIKIYNRFLSLFSNLLNREFTSDEMESIEKELDQIEFMKKRRLKRFYLRIALQRFEGFLKNTFSIIPKDYHTNQGTVLGSSFGMLLGILVFGKMERSLGIIAGLVIGMIIGLIIGRLMDANAIKEQQIS